MCVCWKLFIDLQQINIDAEHNFIQWSFDFGDVRNKQAKVQLLAAELRLMIQDGKDGNDEAYLTIYKKRYGNELTKFVYSCNSTNQYNFSVDESIDNNAFITIVDNVSISANKPWSIVNVTSVVTDFIENGHREQLFVVARDSNGIIAFVTKIHTQSGDRIEATQSIDCFIVGYFSTDPITPTEHARKRRSTDETEEPIDVENEPSPEPRRSKQPTPWHSIAPGK
jgi:hypothetical protein